MTETYTNWGTATSLTLGAPLIFVMLASMAFHLRRAPHRKPWAHLVTIAFIVWCLEARLPYLWSVGAMFAAVGLDPMILERSLNKWLRISIGSVFIFIGLVTAFAYSLNSPDDGFILKEDAVSSRDGVLPKKDAEVFAGSNVWTTSAKEGASFRIGPMVVGSDVYWGPRGVMSGEQVGSRLQEWAGNGKVAKI